jgi:hAT family C-terminal dimerisation region
MRDSLLYAWKKEPDSEDEEVPRLDEYDQYLQEEVIEFNDLKITESALDYWRTVEPRWPNLTRMAFDALSIPAMSSECERCFSSSGNMITDTRNKLNPESVEACKC